MQAQESRVSNAFAVPLPQWIVNQLDKRSEELSVKTKNVNNNILFRGNRTAWIRLVSSIDLVNFKEDQNFKYFKSLGISDLNNEDDLAKSFILQGGTSKYKNNQYNLKGGFIESYNVAGDKETSEYGYKPMPGINSVKIQTQGKLGSIRAADIQIKVWDKAQLDIIDALYFKLGFTMFLEWGHTNYYKSGNDDTLYASEIISLNPFEKDLTKEAIYNKISKNRRDSEGNYDAMLGMVTNFNFTYNQEGGYDCSIKLISLGILISDMKMNNPRILPELQKIVVKKLVNRLNELEKENKRKAQIEENKVLEKALKELEEARKALEGTTPINKDYNAEEFIKFYMTYDENTNPRNPGGGQVSYAASVPLSLNKADFSFNTSAYGWLYFIRRLKGFIQSDDNKVKDYKIKLTPDLLSKITNAKIDDKAIDLSDSRIWDMSGEYLESAKDAIIAPITTVYNFLNYTYQLINPFNDGENQPTELQKNNDTANTTIGYSSYNGLNYEISIKRNLWAYSNQKNIVSSYGSIANVGFLTYTNAAYEYVETADFTRMLISCLNNLDNEYDIINIKVRPLDTKTSIQLNVPIIKTVKVTIDEKIEVIAGTKVIVDAKIIDQNVEFIIPVTLTFNDSDFIKSFSVPETVKQPIDFIGDTTKQGFVKPPEPETPPTPAEPAINLEEVQTSETEKYKSAFEVLVRTIQLYSLDNAIGQNIEIDKKNIEVNLFSEVIYSEFTKDLFSVGLFSTMLDVFRTLKDENKNGKPSTQINIGTESISLQKLCEDYDADMASKGTLEDNDKMLLIRAIFGFHFGLLGNVTTASSLLQYDAVVDYNSLMKTYVVPYQFNSGVLEGTQLNHPVYLQLGLVVMILNHICTLYDSNNHGKINRPIVYFDYNNKTNLCLSTPKHLSTNPYDILIPFQGTNDDFADIIEPSTITTGKNENEPESRRRKVIRPLKEEVSGSFSNVFTPSNPDDSEEAVKDRVSLGLPLFKVGNDPKVESHRGRTMNILVSADYLLKIVGSYTKNNGSGDVYVQQFLEQILYDINKTLGDFNVFRLAYDDIGNAARIVDDQLTPNIEKNHITETNKTQLPLFGLGSIAKSIEIRTEVSSKLSNMIAISANADYKNQANLSKNADSYGFYNFAYRDRYLPNRTEYTSSVNLPTDTMIRSAQQFNNAITTFYSNATPSSTAVGHATNYYIERMSKIKNESPATRSSVMIPVSLNFSIDGMSGFGMGHSFTVSEQFLPYTYNLSLTDPYGNKDQVNTVGFAMVGLDHTIENNQWSTAVRANMIYLKMSCVMKRRPPRVLEAPSALQVRDDTTTSTTNTSTEAKSSNCDSCETFKSRYDKDKEGVKARQQGTQVPAYSYNAFKTVTYKENNTISSPNKNVGGMKSILGVVIHHSAGNLQSDISVMKTGNSNGKVSYHTLVAKDGTRYNFVSENDQAWHAGCSYFEHKDLPNGFVCNDVNSYFLGIAVEGAPNYVGTGGTSTITAIEIDSVAKWIVEKIKKYNMPDDLSTIITHGTVSCFRTTNTKDDVVKSVEKAIKARIRQLLPPKKK